MLASHFIDCLHQNSNQTTQGLADIIETHLECHQDQIQHSENEQELVRLRLLLADKEKQIQQKNSQIFKLQERCKLMQSYEKKIGSLQNKIETLEKLLDRLENEQTHAQVSKSLKNTNNHKTVTLSSEEHLLDCQAIDSQGQRNAKNEVKTEKCLIDKTNQKNNKQNRNPTRENKEAKEKDTKKINKSESKILSPTYYEEAISSKFLNIDKQAEDKSKQIDRKFNKIKQNIETKPKSTKNIDEIYSLLNHHTQGTKMRKQEQAIKEINEKLQNILDESVRLNSRGPSPNRKQVQRAHQRYSVRTRPDFRTEHSHLAADEKQKNESFILKGIINSYRPQKSFILSSRRQNSFTPNEQSMFCNSSLSASTLTKLHNKKLNKILNSTTVNEMLQARKCFNIMGDKRSVLNKSNDYTIDRFERSKAYWG